MKYYDVTQEVFGSAVYPGDPAPEYRRIQEIGKGDPCNLTYFQMCAHNGTHMDAPRHFIDNGRSIEEISLHQMMGTCRLIAWDGALNGRTARKLVRDKEKKIIWKGSTILTPDAAQVFAEEGIELLGVESQTVGTPETSGEVHRILLGADMVLLEGLVLKEVPEGVYELYALPLKLGACDGAPCRVVLGTYAKVKKMAEFQSQPQYEQVNPTHY